MKHFIGSSFAVAVLAAFTSIACTESVGEQTDSSSDKIIGGTVAAEGAWPGATALYMGNSQVCGGTLVAPNWVVSAGHCVIRPTQDNGGITKIVTGRNKLNGTGGETINIKKAYRHTGFNSSTLQNDISLFELETPSTMPLAKLVPQDLATASVVPAAMTTVVGWGSTREGGMTTNDLMQVDVPIIDNATCKAYPRYSNVYEGSICAGYAEGGKDSCQGDSGGPLFMKINDAYYHVGLTSWGIGCARASAPGVYTRTSMFLQWIKDTSRGEVQVTLAPPPPPPPSGGPNNPPVTN
jgi:secreted trypsin-like serine protease